jgi:hypothetical protein
MRKHKYCSEFGNESKTTSIQKRKQGETVGKKTAPWKKVIISKRARIIIYLQLATCKLLKGFKNIEIYVVLWHLIFQLFLDKINFYQDEKNNYFIIYKCDQELNTKYNIFSWTWERSCYFLHRDFLPWEVIQHYSYNSQLIQYSQIPMKFSGLGSGNK